MIIPDKYNLIYFVIVVVYRQERFDPLLHLAKGPEPFLYVWCFSRYSFGVRPEYFLNTREKCPGDENPR